MMFKREVLAPKLRPVWEGVFIIVMGVTIPAAAATTFLLLHFLLVIP